jgi:hypothetical protein
MGLFSHEKQIFVDSVVYNLAGPPSQRVDFLKRATLSGAVTRSKTTISDTIIGSYLRGPAINLRSFGRWAQSSGYSAAIGQNEATLYLPNRVDPDVLSALIPHAAGETVALQTAEIGPADFTYWVDRYMAENHPELRNTEFRSDFNSIDGTITIYFVGGASVAFAATGFNTNSRYLYATYTLVTSDVVGSLVTGSTTTVADEASFPSTTGWTLDSSTGSSGSIDLNVTVEILKTYSDGRPDEYTSTPSTVASSYSNYDQTWIKDTYEGWGAPVPGLTSRRDFLHLIKTMGVEAGTPVVDVVVDVIAGGVTRTTTTTTTTQVQTTTWTHRTDYQRTTLRSTSPLQILIYKQGSGNVAYDALFNAGTNGGRFIPQIPIRINNAFLSDSHYSSIFPIVKKAFKKATDTKFSEIVSKIAENPSLADIDFAFLTYGVTLNTKNPSCMKYLYKFFQQMRLSTSLTNAEFDEWVAEYALTKDRLALYNAWLEAQLDEYSPLYGTAAPPEPFLARAPVNQIQVSSPGFPSLRYDMSVVWSGMIETTGSGLKKPDAKAGELWWEVLPKEITGYELVEASGDNGGLTNQAIYEDVGQVRLHWQVTNNQWRTLSIYGLRHLNNVYEGNYDVTFADVALADEDESKFIVPIHEEVLDDLSLRDATEVSMNSAYLTFNCYKTVTQKWYETSWFRIIILIVMIAVAALTGYIDPNAIGLLGANSAVVPAAVGLSATASAIAGAVANALAMAMVLQTVSLLTTAIFGEKVGAIVTLVIAVASMTMSFSVDPTSFSIDITTNFSKLLEAETLLKLTAAIGDAVGTVVKGAAQDLIMKTEQVLREYSVQAKDIEAKTLELMGAANVLDVLELTDTFSMGLAEPVNTFLSRTLLTGSDIAELTAAFVSNFSEFTLNTELAS